MGKQVEDRAGVLAEYVGLLFQWPTFQLAAAGSATGTTERRRLHEREFVKIRMPMPLVPEQRRIVDLIGVLDQAIAAAGRPAVSDAYRTVLGAMDAMLPAVPIQDVLATAFAGGTPSRGNPGYFNGRIPWLKSGEVENDSIIDTAEHISHDAVRSSAAQLVPAGSTVVAMYGQGETKGRAGFVVSPVTTNQAVLALVPNTDRIDAKYLLHAVCDDARKLDGFTA